MKYTKPLLASLLLAVASFAGNAMADGLDQPHPPTTGVAPFGVVPGPGANLPEFVWTASPVTTQYQLFIKPVGQPAIVITQPATAVCANPIQGVCKYTPAGTMQDGQSYNWWIGTANQHSAPGTWAWSPRYTFNYVLTPNPPTAVGISDLLKPAGNYPTTETDFEWVNSNTASWYLLKIYIEDSNFLAKRKWYTAAQANCQNPIPGIDTCTVNYTAHVGLSPFEDYCWTITPWNSVGFGVESPLPGRCFANTSQ